MNQNVYQPFKLGAPKANTNQSPYAINFGQAPNKQFGNLGQPPPVGQAPGLNIDFNNQSPYAPNYPLNAPSPAPATGTKGQDTQIGAFGKGGYLDLGLQGIGAIGGLAIANKANNLTSDDLNFRREGFNDQFTNQVKLVNNQLYERQRGLAINQGLTPEQADAQATQYVAAHGVTDRK